MFLIITMLIVGAILNFFAPEQNFEVQQAIWPWLAAGMAAKGAIDARVNQTRQNKLDDFRRTAIAMSPWSGMGDPGPQSAGNTSMFGGAVQGGLQGAMIGALGGQAGLWSNPTLGAAKTAADATKVAGAAGAAGSAGAMGTAAKAAAPVAQAAQTPIVPGSMSVMSPAQQAAAPQFLNVNMDPAANLRGMQAAGNASVNPWSLMGQPSQTAMQRMSTPRGFGLGY